MFLKHLIIHFPQCNSFHYTSIGNANSDLAELVTTKKLYITLYESGALLDKSKIYRSDNKQR